MDKRVGFIPISRDITGSLLGPLVTLVQVFDDYIEETRLPATIAVETLLRGPLNGVEVRAARIKWGSLYDDWGGSH